MEINITLQPKQKRALQRSFDTPVLFYGGAKGGGKSYLIRARQVLRRLQYPNTKGLIVRKTYPELLSNHIRMFWKEYPEIKKWYNKSEKTIYFPNGSTTEFSYLKNTDDVYTYQGREYEDIDIDEITQHEEEVFKTLRSSLRTSNLEFSKAGGKVSMLLTGNPGGIGHSWVKRIFIDKNFKPEETPTDFDFIQAFVQDNKALTEADPEYVKRLDDLPEHLRRAYKEGDWNIHAGQAFSELSRHVHIIKPFELPIETRYFAGYDHGYNHPFSFTLFAVVPDGTVYLIKHYKDRLKRPDEIANGIREYTKGLGRIDIFAGLDLWSRGRDGGPTIAEQFYNAGIDAKNKFFIHKAKIDRKQGVAEIRKYLAWQNTDTEKPKVYFFENTKDAFDTVSMMEFDPKEPEDVMKIDADSEGNGGDDAYDSFRYGLMSRAYPPKITDPDYPDDSGMKILQDHLELQRIKSINSAWR